MAARVVYPIVALLFTWAGASARAAEGDAPTAVLGIEAQDVPDAVASEITDAVRQRVAGSKGFRLVQGKDLVEIKLVFSCPDEASACMAQAGKSLGAAKLIYGSVRRSGGDYTVTLKLLDVSRAAIESSVADTVPKARADASSFRALAQQWVTRLGGKASSSGGSLEVRSNVTGAVVILDGTAVGLTASQPLIVSDVAPGKHEIVAQKAGYAAAAQQFTVTTGQSTPLSLSLSTASSEGRDGDAAPDATLVQRPLEPGGPSDRPRSNMSRTGFWIAAVFTAASAAAALKFGLDVRRINGELDQFRRVECSTSSSGYCDSNGRPASGSFDDLPQEQKIEAHNKINDGQRASVFQWVSIGIGVASAAAGGYLFYKGYLDKESGAGPQTADNHGLRIFPTANASSGGVLAEFDF